MPFDTPQGRMDALHKALAASKLPVLIVLHDYPDPDCLASALAMFRLLAFWQIDAHIAYGRGIGRPENKAMAGLLNISGKILEEIDPTAYQGACLMDTQPESGNNALPTKIPILAVIDHHPLTEHAANTSAYIDIREGYGATSTILLEYLQSAGVEIDTPLATALLLGIHTDTNSLLRDASQADIDAYTHLLPLVDLTILQKVLQPLLSDEYFSLLGKALQHAQRYGEAIVALLGDVPQPDMLSMISDLLIDAKGAAWALAIGRHDERVYLSLRVRPPRKTAGNIMRKILSPEGRGGGHALAAGGMMPCLDNDFEEIADLLLKRFLQVVGMEEQARRALLLPDSIS